MLMSFGKHTRYATRWFEICSLISLSLMCVLVVAGHCGSKLSSCSSDIVGSICSDSNISDNNSCSSSRSDGSNRNTNIYTIFYEAVVDWIILMSTCFVAGCLLCNHLRFFLCVSIVDCAIKNYAGN